MNLQEGLIDIHAHLDMMEDSHEVTLQKMKESGVSRVITIGTEPADHPLVLKIAKDYFPQVACTLGVHPHHGSVWDEPTEKFIRTHAGDREVVAIGEIGLDYYYNQSPADEQKEAFRAQLSLAQELNLPVEIHTRDAEKDTVEILKEYKGKVNGVIHCFTGTRWLAEQCLDLGFNISLSGVVTFKNAEELRETAKMLPHDRFHVETDAPFLAPVPMRGKKNIPAFVSYTAQFVADLKGMSVEELTLRTNENARKLFPKLVF